MEDVLRMRLKECLSTVIELEKKMALHDNADLYTKELSVLRKFVQKIDTITVSEEDVVRIENVTERFLCEFSSSLLTAEHNDIKILQ